MEGVNSIHDLGELPNPHFFHICNIVVGATTNPLLTLKTNLTDSCGGGNPSRLAINEPRSFQSLT